MISGKKKYYSVKLSGERLRKCYNIASPRIKQYLNAEINFLIKKISSNDQVLELGCGYGRVMEYLIKRTHSVYGIDNSFVSLTYSRKINNKYNFQLAVMDSGLLGFKNNSFDKVLCIQNGISAFKVEPSILLKESLRVTKKGGLLIFSTYSKKFWSTRLEWFEAQSKEKLLGEIDYTKSGNGTILCKDGFRATTFTKEEFMELAAKLNCSAVLTEVDESSLFCEIKA